MQPYCKEFRDDVVRVARDCEPGVHLKQIAAGFDNSESCLTGWPKAADVQDGTKNSKAHNPASAKRGQGHRASKRAYTRCAARRSTLVARLAEMAFVARRHLRSVRSANKVTRCGGLPDTTSLL